MKKVMIHCDGSSLGNGRKSPRAAAAAILEFNGHQKILGEYAGSSTNQQAEIIAACIGLEALKEPCRVEVVSDSQYVVKTMNGLFKRKTNLDFWNRLDAASRPHQIKWTWTRGHAGHPIQEKCDKAARAIAESGDVNQQILDEILVS